MNEGKSSISEAGMFLAEYTSWLWGCGATCVRTQKNVKRIAEAYGYEVDLTIMPKHVSVALRSEHDGNAEVFTRKIEACGINFSLNTELSALSWSLRDNPQDITEGFARLRDITCVKYGSSWRILILTSLANASFCRLFGGDAIAMAVVFCATFAGFFLKQKLLGYGLDNRLVFFVCAFVSSVLCVGTTVFGWGSTPDIAVATSVLYLIPGVPYINSASDLIDRHYLCSFSRFMDAVALTASLSAGMCLGVALFENTIIR